MFSFKIHILIVAVFVILASFANGQTTVTTTYWKQGTNCTVSTGQRDSWASTGFCLPQDNHPENCDGKASTCGIIYTCEPGSVTIGYWWHSGDECLRGGAEHEEKYPTNTCLRPSKGYNAYDSDTIFTCK